MASVVTWPIFRSKLLERREVAQHTMAFWFERPKDWTFRAGQFIDITLLEQAAIDSEGPVRGFSLASAPHEPRLMIATRMRDTAFKRVLKNMALGAIAKIEGPFGDLVLHDDTTRPAVFLAGGIGITPFRSIAMQAAHEQLPHRIFLFYANRQPAEAPFLNELRSLEMRNVNYKFIPTMTDTRESDQAWGGERSSISGFMIAKHLRAARPVLQTGAPIYYIAGPSAMVEAQRAMLAKGGVGDDDLRIEEFIGYAE